jgi:hypothetical protein
MSADKNLDAVLETGTVAQRTYESLIKARGGARTEHPRDGRTDGGEHRADGRANVLAARRAR